MPSTGALTVLVILAVATIATVVVVLFFIFISSRRVKDEDWELGVSYLIKQKGSNRGLDLFCKLVSDANDRGMVISRTFPDKLRKDENLNTISIWWLSREESPHSVDPLGLAKLTHVVRNFIQEEEEAVILLDGLEYLILQNGFETTLRFIQALNDLIILNKATLVVPVDPSSLSVKQLSLLEKEMETHRLSMSILRFFGD
ncbi:MAG: DUF835 domain-containing protein [Theionarchaea archaeon]|nr:MAG: hypothetical protein AYK18_12535 [Theionarchaea archaeon DG-70]MBU7012302.1 DUF835 domain-containing protein [Theionarchaea archaeon]